MNRSIIVEYTVISSRRGVGEHTYSHFMNEEDLNEFHEWALERGIDYKIVIEFGADGKDDE